MNKFNIDFGELRQRINIYFVAITRDAIGGEIVSKQLFSQCWAKVEPLTARQQYGGQVSHDKQSMIVHMRHQLGIRKQMIVEFDGQDYEIQSAVNIDAADQWLKLMVTNGEDN